MMEDSGDKKGLSDLIDGISAKLREAKSVADSCVGAKPSEVGEAEKPVEAKLGQIRGQLVALDNEVQYILEQIVEIRGLL